ncbi:MAG: hypothetical protein ACI9WU_003083, partial [Myxococcota bacterium]
MRALATIACLTGVWFFPGCGGDTVAVFVEEDAGFASDADEELPGLLDLGPSPNGSDTPGSVGCSTNAECAETAANLPVCVTAICDLVQGVCQTVAKLDGQSCGDPGLCGDRICSAGLCLYTNDTCDDSNPCTADECDAISGDCSHPPSGLCECLEDTDCDDEDVCTVNTCAAGGDCAYQPIEPCGERPADEPWLLTVDDVTSGNPNHQRAVAPTIIAMGADVAVAWVDSADHQSAGNDDDVWLRRLPAGEAPG